MSNKRYDNPATPSWFKALKLLYVSTAKYEGDWHSTLHSHQCTEIFYVVSGSGRFLVENLSFPVQANMIVIINSNVEHTESGVPQSPLEYIVMGVEGSDFLLRNNADTRYCVIDSAEDNHEILRDMQQILLELQDQREHYAVMARNLLENMSIKLLRQKSYALSQIQTRKSGMQPAHLKRYIDSHYKENITLDTLASVSFLNKFYLSHIFSKEYGVSPINYLVSLRVQESRHLLAQTDYSISEIALLLGFSSASYFSQSFARSEKICPSAYRRQARAKDVADAES